MPFFAASEAPPRPESMKFPVFSLLAGNLAFSETSSRLTPPSTGESSANRDRGTREPAVVEGATLPGLAFEGSRLFGTPSMLRRKAARYFENAASVATSEKAEKLREVGRQFRRLRRRRRDRSAAAVRFPSNAVRANTAERR